MYKLLNNVLLISFQSSTFNVAPADCCNNIPTAGGAECRPDIVLGVATERAAVGRLRPALRTGRSLHLHLSARHLFAATVAGIDGTSDLSYVLVCLMDFSLLLRQASP